MTHIEFTGISGVGKSTLYERLLQENKFYDGSRNEALIRNHPWPLDGLLRVLPSPVRSRYLSRLWTRHKLRYYDQFLNVHPEYESLVASTGEVVDNDEQRMRELLVKTAIEYQLGHTTVREQERLVLDEGFCHRAASMAARTEAFDIPVTEFLDAVPLPDVLVYVRASDEVINQRLRTRGGEAHNLERLHQNRRFIDHLSESASLAGVTVLEIENTKRVANVSAELVNRLNHNTK